jgi:hypothetical protein
MGNVTLVPQTITRAGVTPARTASGASPLLNVVDNFQYNNTGREFLHFMKSAATSCNVVIDTPGTVDGLAIANRTVVVPATTGDVMIGPLPPDTYNAPGTSTLSGFTLDNIAGLTLAIMRL